ncbi:glucohydrolase [Blastococcus sp. TF02-09]|uniref:glycoside hydrolase family 13 protein n=1 Tax=Blastococcus sp. TF02-09 TaxID=2250576 RepID=UPI000DE8900B|nr:alpha-glucosidase [Blastococcus sp. TF02-9]RBY76596.1 glucohydrolase [Blastococcus sp. TF02-9]
MDSAAAPWWTRAVVYQVYPRSFMDSDGDGIGDLGGILQRLDHLADLGVDVLWLSPVHPSPQADNGYDISDYRDIDPLFGSLAQLDELITALHARGMKLVMDLVVNHTSDAHPWFVESRSSPDSPQRDWYWWRPPRAGFSAGEPGAEPTNWQSFFSGPVWELDGASGEYYLHLFDRRQPDLNWENPQVRTAVYEMMRWWLDRGVDGFRMDVINMISKDVAPDGSLRDGRPIPGSSLGSGFSSFLNGPRIHEFLQEMHREVFAGRDGTFLTVGEMPGVTVEEARRYTHDQPRAVSRFGDDSPRFRRDSATCLATLLHLHRGTPYVYQGEELGMANFPFQALEEFADVESLNHSVQAVSAGHDPGEVLAALRAMSRDNARTPVQWDASPNAGFTTGTPWLAVNPDHVEWNAAAQREDPTSVLAHYRRLIALRHELPVVALGDFSMLLPDHDEVYAFTRSLDGVTLLVVCNLSRTPHDLASLLPAAVDAELVLGNLPDAGAELRPWEARVLQL